MLPLETAEVETPAQTEVEDSFHDWLEDFYDIEDVLAEMVYDDPLSDEPGYYESLYPFLY